MARAEYSHREDPQAGQSWPISAKPGIRLTCHFEMVLGLAGPLAERRRAARGRRDGRGQVTRWLLGT